MEKSFNTLGRLTSWCFCTMWWQTRRRGSYTTSTLLKLSPRGLRDWDRSGAVAGGAELDTRARREEMFLPSHEKAQEFQKPQIGPEKQHFFAV